METINILSGGTTCVRRIRWRYVAAVVVSLLVGVSSAEAAPRVVVSLKPIHALVAGVMGETGKPFLLMPGLSSPHQYVLKPSEARALEAADLVVWVGPTMEAFLIRPLANTPSGKRLTLIDARGLYKWPIRSGGLFEPDDDDLAVDPGAFDGHIWLDPRNAAVIATAVRDRLVVLDPDHAQDYIRNARGLLADLEALDSEMSQRLTPLKGKPFIVFHDAYQYLERRYGLKVAGSVSIGAEAAGHAKRISRLRERVREGRAVCVFTEPQFSPSLANVVVEGTRARVGVLDHLGAAHAEGRALYFEVMRDLANALAACLEP